MKTATLLRFWAVALSILSSASFADAQTYSVALGFRWPVELVDAGIGEDNGTDPNGAWLARGAVTSVMAGDEQLWTGSLNQGACTDVFEAPVGVSLTVHVLTWAVIGNSVEIVVRESSGAIEQLTLSDVNPPIMNSPGAFGTFWYDFPKSDRTTIMAVATYTLSRFNPIGLANETFILNDSNSPSGSTAQYSGGEIWLGANRRNRKFVIAHEIGHALLDKWTSGYVSDCSYKVGTDASDTCGSNGSHRMTSKEYNSCALSEGFAHFVGAYTFNNMSGGNPTGSFQYWVDNSDGTPWVVNIESGPIGGATKYMESTCSGSDDGYGVELDWLRLFWDYRTNNLASDPGTKLTNSQIMSDLGNAIWSTSDAFERVGDWIEINRGADQRDRWDEFAAANGADH